MTVDPLHWDTPIVDQHGRPTNAFLRQHNNQRASNALTIDDIAKKVSKAGDTMTGPLILSAAPTVDLGAATKKYVDDNGGAGAFTDLSDVPDSYSGQASKVVSVKSDESGLEFTAGGGGGSALHLAAFDTGASSVSTSAFAFKGVIMQPRVDITLVALWALISPTVSGAAYQGCAAEVSSITSTAPTIAAAPRFTDSYTAPDAATEWVRITFATPIVLSADTPYALMVGRTDGGATYGFPIPAATSRNLTPVISARMGFLARLASAAPANGDTLNTNSGGPASAGIALEWSL